MVKGINRNAENDTTKTRVRFKTRKLKFEKEVKKVTAHETVHECEMVSQHDLEGSGQDASSLASALVSEQVFMLEVLVF